MGTVRGKGDEGWHVMMTIPTPPPPPPLDVERRIEACRADWSEREFEFVSLSRDSGASALNVGEWGDQLTGDSVHLETHRSMLTCLGGPPLISEKGGANIR